jgi:hypothetical protein
MAWIKVEYPAYASVGIVRLTDEQLANPMKHYHKNTEDLVYRGMNVDILLAFMACVKVMTGNKEGKFRSYSNFIKFHNAISYGASQANVALSTDYHLRIEDLCKSYKKEAVKKKQAGELDENDSDPITFLAYLPMGTGCR